MSLDAAEVMATARAWVWVPPDCPEIVTEEFRLIAYPAGFTNPTVVASVTAGRPAAEVVDDVLAAAASLDRSDVTFWTDPSTRPTDLVEHLLARGAVLDEDLAVLARPLDTLPDLDVPHDVEIRPVDDLATSRDIDRVSVAVFGGAESSDAELAAELDRADLSTGLGYVAYRDEVPVASAGLTVRGGAARLWGGGVLPAARGTGAYRALLAHRLAVGVEHDAPLALVKGRVETSAPILRRAGFRQYGEERSYRLVVT